MSSRTSWTCIAIALCLMVGMVSLSGGVPMVFKSVVFVCAMMYVLICFAMLAAEPKDDK